MLDLWLVILIALAIAAVGLLSNLLAGMILHNVKPWSRKGVALGLFIVLLGSAALAVAQKVGSTPAQDATAAMDRCNQDLKPDTQNTTTFSAGHRDAVFPPVPYGEQAPNGIRDGDVIRIAEVSGSIQFDGLEKRVGPGGNGVAAPRGWFVPGAPQYSAILRYNNNPTGWVGDPFPYDRMTTCTRYTGGMDVRLAFLMNLRSDQSGKSGAWTFTLKVYRD
ncbi:hypothetical protein [Nonomuraea endophytica]|uniref:Uncharacterized protein n=1 Tax=Nonomuraea endophytica TaxID=714136 RepID=A0A7W8AE98_9ACTN|nr:hypothetical protein [Nonomuraea endophytica]MBB5084079.1 hypothetical protein [Nonomuraea endophytica]